jgi:hypothetical protein
MQNEVLRLDSNLNFTKESGLVYELDEKAEIVSRVKSHVFVFSKVGRNLKFSLAENAKIGILQKIKQMVEKDVCFTISVSFLPRFFRFRTDFNFGDLKVTDVMVETQLKAKIDNVEDIAVTYAEGSDPVKDICYMLKSHLSRVFTEIRLEDLDNLQEFTESVYKRVSEMRVEHPFIALVKTSVQYKIPEDIEKAFEEIQKEKIDQKKARARANREKDEMEHAQELEHLKSKLDMELKEFQLDKLGIQDGDIRILMSDPDKRTKYLEDIYSFRREIHKTQTDFIIDTVKKKQELILRYFEQSSKVIDHKEMKEILKLIDDSIIAFTGESFLNKIVINQKSDNRHLLQESTGETKTMKRDTPQ